MNQVLKIAIFFLFFVNCLKSAKAQSGFGYVDFPSDASQNALGGQVISLMNAQPLSFFQNPALLDSAQGNKIGVGLSPVFGQGLYSAIAYISQRPKKSFFAIGFRGITFGEFTGVDAIGNPTENFGAGNLMLTASYAQKRKFITFGVAAKLVISFIESYNSTALLFDFGGTFKHPEKDLSIGLTIRNMGGSVTNFTDVQQQLPFDMLLGVSVKPQYMPVRFTFTADQLMHFETLVPTTNTVEFSTFQQVFGHLSGGAELLVSKKITPLVGFNYRLNQSMSFIDNNRFGGFSYGVRFAHKRFLLAASRTNFLPQIGRWVFSSSFGI